jgi:hypothetical protein
MRSRRVAAMPWQATTVTLRTTPAMAAGVTHRLWEIADLVELWEAYERRLERAA